jgi:hypothetical protein
MEIELHKLDLEVAQEVRLAVHCHGRVLGECFAHLLVAGAACVKLKAGKRLPGEHELVNFDPKPAVKREVSDNVCKGTMH